MLISPFFAIILYCGQTIICKRIPENIAGFIGLEPIREFRVFFHKIIEKRDG